MIEKQKLKLQKRKKKLQTNILNNQMEVLPCYFTQFRVFS